MAAPVHVQFLYYAVGGMDGIWNRLRLWVASLLIDAFYAYLVVSATHLNDLPGTLVATCENLDDISPANGHRLDLVLRTKLLGQARRHHLGPGLCVGSEIRLTALAAGCGNSGVELHSRVREAIQKTEGFQFQIK